VLTQAQTQIIINEFSQGPSGFAGDWIELVVTADATDIRGVYYDDDNTSGTGILGKEYSVRLRDTSAFQNVNKGSIIVIYRNRPAGSILPADDTDFSDGTLVLHQSNTDFLTMTNGLTLKANRDEFGIFYDNGDLEVVVGIHGVTWGGETGNTSLYLTGWGYTDEIDSVKAGQSAYFSEDTPGEVDTATYWTVQAFSSATPGSLNGGNNNSLPVELISFSALLSENEVILNWKTETEVDNYGFNVERKRKDENWNVLGFVEGNGNSNSPKEYRFVDNDISNTGKYYYRLKQIDTDGSYEYSKSIFIDFDTPATFELKQNYPNPFNPSTTISFSLTKNEYVRLVVFNTIGEEVETLYKGKLDAGIHTYNFNAEDLSSGIYFYKLNVASNVQIKKMMLLK
jgi:hypothetical protein